MKQHEITSPIPLLDDAGNLTQPGWARKLYPVYDRAKGKRARWGKVVLDAGTEIELKDFFGFAERVENKW